MTLEQPSQSLDSLAPAIGLRIKQARKDKNLSQKDLVGERFSKSYISSIERGKITPSLKALDYIARRSGVSVVFLLTGLEPGQTLQISGNKLESEDTPSRSDLLLLEARILREQGQSDAARILLQSKIKPRQLNTEQLKLYHYTLARLYIDLHDSEAALVELEVARDLAEKTNDYETLAKVRHLMGGVYMFQNKPVQAIEQLRNALQSIEAGLVKDFQFQLGVYSNLGILNYQLGDKEEAISMYREALIIAENAASQEKSASMYWSLSQNYRDNGNYSNSKTYALKSLALYEWATVSRALPQLRAGFGVIMLEAKRFEEAEEQFNEALKLAALYSDLEGLTYANLNLTELYLEQGQTQKARQFSDEMLKHLDSVDLTTRGQAYSNRGSLLAALEDNEGAVQYFELALEVLSNSPSKELLSKVYFRFAGVLRNMGNTDRAAEMYDLAFRHLN